MASLKEKLIEDLHLLLGGGMVDVDLDPAHYDLAVRTAIERYQMRSSNAWEEAFMILTTQVGKDTYFLPRDVIIVRSVYRSGGAGIGIGGSGALDPFELMISNSLYSSTTSSQGGTTSLASYDLTLQKNELIGRLFRRELLFTWEESRARLQFHRTFAESEPLLLRIYNVKPEDTLLIDRFAKPWIRDYSLAKCKQMLGEARSKFQSLAGPNGGITLNGDALKEQATAELERLETELHNLIEQREGYGMIIG